MSFYGAQTFLLDSSTVNQSSGVYLSKATIYFKNKPSSTGNRSGITNPGVTVFLAPTQDGVPVIGDISQLPLARCEYNDVMVSGDASIPTQFKFASYPILSSGKSYALVLKFDGDDDFQVWNCVQGDVVLGTANTISSGPAGQYYGEWYDYVSPPSTSPANQVTSNLSSSAIASAAPVVITAADGTSWRARSSVDLKFGVSVARFSHRGNTDLSSLVSNTLIPPSALINPSSTGVSVDSNTGIWTFEIPSSRYEFIHFDPKYSHPNDFSVGERVWQVQPLYFSGLGAYNISVANGSNRITANSSGLNFQTLFGQGVDPSYIIVVSGNTSFCRLVTSVESNTSILVDKTLPITNSGAHFYKAPVAVVDSIVPSKIEATDVDLLVLSGSNANSSLRFANSVIEKINVVTGGSGYANTDYVTVYGYENVTGKVGGGSIATAYLTTNSTGGIVQTYMISNQMGAGFSNSASLTFYVSNANNVISSGTGATFSANIGMTIASEGTYNPGANGYCANCVLVNPGITEVLLNKSIISNPMGTYLSAEMVLSYYRVSDSSVIGGWAYYVDGSVNDNDVFFLTPNQTIFPQLKKSRIFPSWSNELVIYNASNGSVQSFTGGSSTNSAITIVTAASNNDFTMVVPGTLSTVFSHYLVNNDYTNENTDQGNSSSRDIEAKVTLANGSYAEDIRVWIDAWKPATTDVKVFARIQNDADQEAFDDKDWTLLSLVSGSGFSSLTDQTDTIEFGYGFPQYPNTALTLTGTVTTSNGSPTITGSGTSFNTQVANGDVIKIYNPLFSSTDHMVTMVSTVTNATSLTLTEPIANSGVVGGGMLVDKIGYPRQAFNNILNENVVRYFSMSGGAFDTFNTMQIKVILLSPDYLVVPRVDDLRVVAVSS